MEKAAEKAEKAAEKAEKAAKRMAKLAVAEPGRQAQQPQPPVPGGAVRTPMRTGTGSERVAAPTTGGTPSATPGAVVIVPNSNTQH
jgi:hypothetical protein